MIRVAQYGLTVAQLPAMFKLFYFAVAEKIHRRKIKFEKADEGLILADISQNQRDGQSAKITCLFSNLVGSQTISA